MDLGIIHTKQFVMKLIHENPIDMNDDNYKDQLMRVCQNMRYQLPVYNVDSFLNGIFYMSVVVNAIVYGRGQGTTKKQAEQIAAFDAIKNMGVCVTNAS
jgi:ribonuclease-3